MALRLMTSIMSLVPHTHTFIGRASPFKEWFQIGLAAAASSSWDCSLRRFDDDDHQYIFPYILHGFVGGGRAIRAPPHTMSHTYHDMKAIEAKSRPPARPSDQAARDIHGQGGGLRLRVG